MNTHKHGVRGQKKTAVADLFVYFFARDTGEPSINDRLIGATPIVNYNGESWPATILVDDLTQLWELFLRNYTDVDTTAFRVEIGKLHLAAQQQSVYSASLPAGIEAHLKGLADGRMSLDV